MAWVETRNGRHRGLYRDAQGNKHSVGWFTSKREAKGRAQEEEAKIRAGTWTNPNAGKMTFSDYFENHWLPNRGGEDNTKQNYRNHYNAALKKAFGDMELRKITTGVVQRWVARQEAEGVKPRTIRDRYVVLQTVLAARKGVSAMRDKLIPLNPCADVTLPVVDPRPVVVYSVEESDAIQQAMDPWWRPVVLLAAETGMRWGELMGLKVSDFGPDYREVTIQRTVIELTKAATDTGTPFKYKHRPKGKKPRKIAMTPEAAQMVKELVRQRRLFPADRLFSMPDKDGLPVRTPEWPEGLPVSRHYFRRIWNRVHVSTGVRRLRPYDLRGSHISWLLAGGADTTAVMNRVGHKQLSTTQKYVDALKDADARALEALAVTKSRAKGGRDGRTGEA